MEIIYKSPIGPLALGFTGKTLTGLKLSSGEDENLMEYERGQSIGVEIIEWLKAYFKGENPSLNGLDFKAKGTAFQERVWNALKTIPYGYCVTYGFLAMLIAPQTRKNRLLARAVGNALARNPIWILIPCHRVILANGEIGSYAGGVEMKKTLLKLERVNLKEFSRDGL